MFYISVFRLSLVYVFLKIIIYLIICTVLLLLRKNSVKIWFKEKIFFLNFVIYVFFFSVMFMYIYDDGDKYIYI